MSQTMNITDSNFQIDATLALPKDEVQLWRVDLEAIRGDETRWQGVLSPDEKTRAARFHFHRDRQLYVASRAMLRTILAAYLTSNPADLSFSYSQKEKPSLADSGRKRPRVQRLPLRRRWALCFYAATRDWRGCGSDPPGF